MKLTLPDYVVLIVDDLDKALGFYTEVLGLRLGHRSGEFAQLDTGATRLSFYTREAMAKTIGSTLQPPAQDAPGFEIGFKVPDVDAAFTELVTEGASPVTSPTTRPWGQRTAYIRDPDGNLIELAQDLGRK
jgi:catechol 2,3-dioxygenase-like lactoylglutathione lyase family enzyme